MTTVIAAEYQLEMWQIVTDGSWLQVLPEVIILVDFAGDSVA